MEQSAAALAGAHALQAEKKTGTQAPSTLVLLALETLAALVWAKRGQHDSKRGQNDFKAETETEKSRP